MFRNRYIIFLSFFCILSTSLFSQTKHNEFNNMEGTTFVFSIPPISSGQSKAKDIVVLTLISQYDTKVKITAKYGFVKTLEMKPFEKVSLSLSSFSAFPYQKSAKEKAIKEAIYDAAIQIEASRPISVSAAVKNENGGEGFAVLPIESLGRKYIISSFNDASNYYSDAESLPSIVTITANYNNTHVKFQLGGNAYTKTAEGLQPGEKISNILSQGDVWVISSSGANADLSGSKIEASLPVSVVSGNQAANVPIDNPPSNYIAEMELPIHTYGKVFLVPALPDRKHSPVLRIVAKEDNTTLQILGAKRETRVIPKSGGTIHSGYLELRINEPNSAESAYIIADKPISVTLYNAGAGEEKNENDISSIQKEATPFQMVLIPQEQELKSYMFAIPENNGEQLFDENVACLIAEESLFAQKNSTDDQPHKIQFGEFNGVSWHWGAPSIAKKGDEIHFHDTLQGKRYIAAFYDIKTLSTCQIRANKNFALYLFGQSRGSGAYGTIAGMGLRDLASGDTWSPVPTWKMLCGGHIVGRVEDKPDEEEHCANLTLPTFYAAESFNYEKKFDPIIPGVTKSANWELFVRDKSKDAKAIIKFSDKAGNDTVITIEYFTPKIKINPQEINFEIVKLEEVKVKKAKLHNNSVEPFFVERIYLKNNSNNFEIINPPLGEIMPNEIKEFQVKFSAKNKGVFCDTIVIEDKCVARNMGAVKAAVNNSEIFAQDVNFGEHLVNSKSKRECFVKNYGNCELKIYDAILPKNKVFSVDFSIEFTQEQPLILKKGESMHFVINFVPDKKDTYIDSLIFISDAFGVDSITVINAAGVNPGLVAESYNWGKSRIYRDEFPVYAKSVDNGYGGVRLSNKSNFNIKIEDVYIVDENDSKTGFIVDNVALNALIGKTLHPSEQYIIPVDFLPTKLKDYSEKIYYISASGNKSISTLEGKGVVPNYNVDFEDFDTLLINNFDYPQIKAISINNLQKSTDDNSWNFDDTLTIFSIESPDNSILNNEYSASGFKLNLDEDIFPIKLEPGENLRLNCSFVPTKIGENKGKLIIKSDALEDKEINIKGYGTGKIVLTQSSGLDLCQGEKGVVECIIKNNAASEITVKDFYISSETSVFSIDNLDKQIVLSPNEIKRIEVMFNPLTLGEYNAYLKFNVVTKDYQASDSVSIRASSELARRLLEVSLSDDKIDIGTPLFAKVNLIKGVDIERFAIDDFSVKLSYNSDIIMPQISNIRMGDLISGKFIIENTDFDVQKKELNIHIKTVAGEVLEGFGELLEIPFSTFFPLEHSNKVDINVEIQLQNNCVTFVPTSINSELEDVCAFDLRQINISNTEYKLELKNANPIIEDKLKVEFGVGLDNVENTLISLYSSNGDLIARPVNKSLEAGTYELTVSTSNLASGVYYFVMKSAHFYQTKKIVIQK